MQKETLMSPVDTLLAVVREIEPIVQQHAAQAERERKLPAAVAKAM